MKTAMDASVTTWIIFVVVFFVILYFYNLWFGLPRGLPPGPKFCRLPVFGSLPWVSVEKTHTQLREWEKLYGGIYHLQMGSQLCIILHDLKLIKEAFAKEEFSGRPHLTMTDIYADNLTKGVLFAQGPSWKEHRRFTLSCLRDFGMGRYSLEGKIMEEVKVLLEIMETEDNQNGYDIKEHLTSSISIIICNIVFGKHYSHDDPTFRKYLGILDEQVGLLANGSSQLYLPFLRHLPWSAVEKFSNNWSYIKDTWYKPEIEEHKASCDFQHSRDYIDSYLTKMNQCAETDRQTSLHCEQLLRMCGDLFGAGTETTMNTLQWGFLYMILYPGVQQKVQAEIDDVVGRGRFPSLRDRNNLPYTDATTMEILRCSTVVPLGVLRATTMNAELGGYKVPAKTVIIPNLWAVSHDAKYWENPEEFKPERFLDANGKVFKPDAFIPFSTGTRVCLGELLAKMEIFLFLVCLLQRFTLKAPDGEDISTPNTGKLGITLAPTPFKMCVVPR